MNGDVRVRSDFVIPGDELDWRFTTSSGPGGQHANRSNTRAELRWNPLESGAGSERQRARIAEKLGELVIVQVDDHRSQKRNRNLALERLGARVREALHEDKPRRATRPSRAAKRRRADAKRQRGRIKQQRRRPSLDD
ncbi:MAG: alternative ribosome rescue aminoacyl-tRNA hydrolase ArfB [Actinomycetota bacterium]|jgi:ribosome-associated protein|nr:alternative ribosome rescue aminoacyl-tRNA hydrolase ArfB [Actinomycetota bacterium]